MEAIQMADWCHEFDFTLSNGGFYAPPNRWTPLRASTTGPFCSPYGCWVRLYAGHSTASRLSTTGYFQSFSPASSGEYTYIWEGSRTMSGLGLAQYESQQPTLLIRGLKLYGVGASPLAPTKSVQPAGGGEVVFIYRVPITGNPSETEFTTQLASPVVVNQYAIDPLTRHLWLHSANGWFKVTATDRSSGTVLKPQGCSWIEDAAYTSNDRIILPAETSELAMLKASLGQIIACISNGVSNATGDYPLGDVPWPAQGSPLPQFTRFPMSVQQICQGTPAEMHSLGVPDDESKYGLPGLHNGTDFFAPSGSDVYAIENNGLVVGIGVEGKNTRSAGNWGATEIQEGTGYSVIIRYGHLYILYGHLLAVDSRIYVGKRVDIGTRIGEIGTFTGSDPHLHLEIRSFGESVGADKLVLDTSGMNNSYGILKLGGLQALDTYDVMQFFATTSSVAEIDTVDPSTQTLSVTGLGLSIVDGNSISFTATPVNTLSCTLPFTRLYRTQGTSQIGSYRGFVLTSQSVLPPTDPNTVTQL